MPNGSRPPATITALTAGHVLAALHERGVDYELVARKLGLPPTLQPEFEWRVPVDAVDALFAYGIERFGPDFPILARPSRPEDNRSPVNLYCRTRASVREALVAISEVIDLVTDAYRITLQPSPSGGILGWTGIERASLWWFDLADSLASIRTVLGPQARFLFVEAPFEAPPMAQGFFGCDVRPGGSFSAHLPRELLDRSVPVDPALRAMTERWLAALRPPPASASSIIATLRALGPTTTVERLAGHLGISERTLHRRLSEGKTSFRAELDALRAALAERLAGTKSAEEIALLLGYSDSRAYRRASQRWR